MPSPAVEANGELSACGHRRVGRRPYREWAALMERSFPPSPRLRRASLKRFARMRVDVLACPRCAGRMTLVALIHDAAVVSRILRHLGLPDAVPTARAGRAPPLPWEADTEPEGFGVD